MDSKIRQQAGNCIAEDSRASRHRVVGYVPVSAVHRPRVVPAQIARLGLAMLCDSLRHPKPAEIGGEGLSHLGWRWPETCILARGRGERPGRFTGGARVPTPVRYERAGVPLRRAESIPN